MKKEQQRQGVQQEILMSEVQRQDEKLNFELHKQGGELQKQGGKVQKQGKELKRLGGELQRQDQKLQRRDQKLQRQVIGLKSDLEKAVLSKLWKSLDKVESNFWKSLGKLFY